MPRAFIQRFWKRVNRRQPTDCWPWIGCTNGLGYGRVKLGARCTPVVYTHRVAWELSFGAIPEGKQVLHRCDNPPCCNPGHLFVGTQLDNMHDAIAKGRNARGARVGSAKLTDAKVLEIRAARAGGEKGVSVAARFGISQATVSEVCSGKLWRGVA